MDNIKPILEQFAEALKADIKSVSKRFKDTIESIITESSIEINGSPYISVLIDGRKPTRPNAPKGNPTLQEILHLWIQEKGIVARANENGKVISQLSLSWAMAKSMHLKGDSLYQRGGGNNIFAGIVTQQRLNAFSNSIGSVFTSSVSSDILKDFK